MYVIDLQCTVCWRMKYTVFVRRARDHLRESGDLYLSCSYTTGSRFSCFAERTVSISWSIFLFVIQVSKVSFRVF